MLGSKQGADSSQRLRGGARGACLPHEWTALLCLPEAGLPVDPSGPGQVTEVTRPGPRNRNQPAARRSSDGAKMEGGAGGAASGTFVRQNDCRA